MKSTLLFAMVAFMLSLCFANSQQPFNDLRISGNYQLDAQYYQNDTLIGALDVPEKTLSQGFLFLNMSTGDFSAQMRYEAYMNPILGIDPRFGNDHGFAFRQLNYNTDFIDVTVGNFYEQFGSGIIFRAYEERQLGVDYAIDGLRTTIRPTEGIEFTGLIGKQRLYWDFADAIIRAANVDINMRGLFQGIPELYPKDIDLTIGGSVVSKFQADRDSRFNFPENTLAWSTRFNLITSSMSIDGEYAFKHNDPSTVNKFNFNPGQGVILNASYFDSGIGASLNFHTIDNMDFRSGRSLTLQDGLIGFVAPLTRQHLWRLVTIYPYATQFNGEIGIQAELTYTFDKGTLIGGDYGTTINLNFSQVNGLNRTVTDSSDGRIFKYDVDLFKFSDDLYFKDFNVTITKKFSTKFKTNIAFISLVYDKDRIEKEGVHEFGEVRSNTIIADAQYNFNSKNSLRLEFQHMWSEQDSTLKVPDNLNGDWALLLAEYTFSPHWYISLWDEFNYGNYFEERQLHYLNSSVAYVHESTRIAMSYGRQRGGLLCVGGVCRPVPASNGFSLSITSSF